jgi:hypothetical protein
LKQTKNRQNGKTVLNNPQKKIDKAMAVSNIEDDDGRVEVPRPTISEDRESFNPATTRLQISLSAKSLKNIGGIMQKSDPFAIVTARGDNPNNSTPRIVGRTNV